MTVRPLAAIDIIDPTLRNLTREPLDTSMTSAEQMKARRSESSALGAIVKWCNMMSTVSVREGLTLTDCGYVFTPDGQINRFIGPLQWWQDPRRTLNDN